MDDSKMAAEMATDTAVEQALQAVWDLGDQLDSNHTRYAATQVADRFGVEIRAHNDFSDPPRNRNEEIIHDLQAQVDRLAEAMSVKQEASVMAVCDVLWSYTLIAPGGDNLPVARAIVAALSAKASPT